MPPEDDLPNDPVEQAALLAAALADPFEPSYSEALTWCSLAAKSGAASEPTRGRPHLLQHGEVVEGAYEALIARGAVFVFDGFPRYAWHMEPSALLDRLQDRPWLGVTAGLLNDGAVMTPGSFCTRMRLYLWRGQLDEALALWSQEAPGWANHVGLDATELLQTACAPFPQAEILAALEASFGERAARGYVRAWVRDAAFGRGSLPPEVETVARASKDRHVRDGLAGWYVLRGRADEATSLCGSARAQRDAIACQVAFWAGDLEAAAELADQGAPSSPRAGPWTRGPANIVRTLLLMWQYSRGVRAACDRLEAWLRPRSKYARDPLPTFHRLMEEAKSGILEDLGYDLRDVSAPPIGWTDALGWGLVMAWMGVAEPEARQHEGWQEALDMTGRVCARWSQRDDLPAIAPMFRDLATTYDGGDLAGFAAQVPMKPRWRRRLDRVRLLAQPQGARPELWWEVSFHGGEVANVVPRIITSPRQKKGTLASLRELVTDPPEWLEGIDRRVLSGVVAEFDDEYEFRYGRGLRSLRVPMAALVDHPRVRDEDGHPLRITRGRPKLIVRSDAVGSRVTLDPPELLEHDVAIRPTEDEVQIFALQDDPRAVVEELVSDELVVPRGESELELVAALLPQARWFDLEGSARVSFEPRTIPAQDGLALRLRWARERLWVELFAQPFGPEGPTVLPGEGDRSMDAALGGELLRVDRDLPAERDALQEVLEAAAALARCLEPDPDHPEGPRLTGVAWGLEGACEVLAELATLPASRVRVSWPDGAPLRLSVSRGPQDFRIVVQGESGRWLRVTGEVQVDEGEVIAFRELLRRPRTGRFVELDRGRILALTEDAQRRLDGLARLDAGGDAQALRVHPALAPLLRDQLGEGATLDFDASAESAAAKVEAAMGSKPRVPRGLRATLRPYQRAGFVWMARLAAAGLGGCLADDMGLGKTVQALALLLARARHGPALVVAPTSVVPNWLSEGRRFAPSLRMSDLRDADRRALVADAGPKDVIVCSYGLLARDAELLGGRSFATVIYDEAQALKNSRSRRAQAAHGIQAEARFALTGTPLENHLLELWSVMEAIVPGLLGSERHFEDVLGRPIMDGDEKAMTHLKARLEPFILRRTKERVLRDLPPCTDMMVRVEPTRAEASFYEAMRRRAEELAQEARSARGAQARSRARFNLLAEIGRLRRAAADPRLVDPKAPAGSKVEAAMERLQILVEEGHRALVFTQHLELLGFMQQALDAAKISYLTLEGKTPASERARRIEAFSRGEAQVFLMSLKAGGVGVNLTAADYVLHLDPWWNPAVEDQATGRAHRIGQERPVTILRFVTAATIEETILQMHADKRALASDVLAGLDTRKKLDLDALGALLTVPA